MSQDERRFNIFCDFLIWGSLIVFCLIISGCSPCNRLSRLSSKHPQCLQQLNQVITDSGTAVIANRDSSTAAVDTALNALQDTVFKYITILQDCSTSKGAKDSAGTKIANAFKSSAAVVKDIIRDVPCLQDTAVFTDAAGATLKLWQEGKEIKYSLTYPSVKYELKEPGWPWWVWLSIGIAGTTVLYVVRGRKG